MKDPCKDCGIKGLYEGCEEKCVMYKKHEDEIFMNALKQIERVPAIPEDEWEIEYKGECICCGTITAIRSTYNGHLHAGCDKCDFRLMERGGVDDE